jgi:hypothetical protein
MLPICTIGAEIAEAPTHLKSDQLHRGYNADLKNPASYTAPSGLRTPKILELIG